MKPRHLTWAACLILVLAGCNRISTSPSPEAAVRYNESVVLHCDSVTRAFDVFLESIDARDADKAQRRLEVAVQASDHAQVGLSKLQDHMGDTQLRDAARDLVGHYQRSLEGDFKVLLPALLRDTLEENDALRVDAFLNAFAKTEDSLFKRMVVVQMEFSKKHGLTLQ
jgi:hypothetical protein